MNNWVIITIMSLIQGITEFLPISSSGHLAIMGKLFSLPTETGLALSIVLHAGSLLAIAAFYFRTLIGFFKKDQFHLLLMVICGSIPAGIAGIILKKTELADKLFGDMISVAMGLLITASILRLTGKEKLRCPTQTPLKQISLKQAVITGFAQAFAIIPGVSRSGSTIAAGILAGIEFEAAAAFSFLLALPAIFGASLLEFIDLSQQNFQISNFSTIQLATAFIISASTSFASLIILVKLIRKRKLAWFSWYLFFIGASILIWQIISSAKGNY